MFEKFVRHGVYIKGWSTRTPDVYRRAYASLQQSLGDAPEGVITRTQLQAWVIFMRERGLTPAGINIDIRSMNSYLTWLHEEGIVKEHLKLKQIKSSLKPVTVFSEAEIKAVLSHKPKRLSYQRTWVMVALMLDTGCRIDEVLTLRKAAIDFDNVLITVTGKGSKVRRIPFSLEMRKHLFRY